MSLLIGADPEVFIKHGLNHVSSHTFLPGNKLVPYKVKGGAVQVDGTAAEFNIDPARTAEEFVENMNSVLAELKKFLPPEHTIDPTPVITYDYKYFHSLPDANKDLGCDPDWNAYNRKLNVIPPEQIVGAMRTGSGHLHLGWTQDKAPLDPVHMDDCILMTKAMDKVFMGMRYIWDKDKTREAMYGKPGAFRPKSYGVEYRHLSNAWVKYPKMWPWLFNMTKAIYEKLIDVGEIVTYQGMFHYPRTHLIEDANYYLSQQKFPLLDNSWFVEPRKKGTKPPSVEGVGKNPAGMKINRIIIDDNF